MSEIVTLWLRKRFPEEYGPEAQARVSKLVDQTIKDSGMPPLSDKGAWEAKEKAAMDYYFAKAEREFDTSILEHLDLDVRGLFEVLDKADHQSRAGSHRAKTTKNYMSEAVDAFIKAESEGLDFTQSLKFAREEIRSKCNGQGPHDTNLRKWLNEIAGKSWSTIPASPGRGRQKTIK